jgi:hypothetical protein
VTNTLEHPVNPNAQYPYHVHTEWRWVSPADAARYLEGQHDNRPESRISSATMEENLRDGTFYPAISPVYFDADERAWDGQHRFEAIVNTGIGSYLLFVVGVTPNEADYIDTGRKRTVSDVWGIHNVANAAKRAALARLMTLYTKYGIAGIRYQNRVVTQAQQTEYQFIEGMDEAITIARHAGKLGATQSSFGFMVLATGDNSFWESVVTGEDLHQGDPALTLRNWYLHGRRQVMNTSSSALKAVELYVLARAWNAYVRGERISRFQPTYDMTQTGRKIFKGDSIPDLVKVNPKLFPNGPVKV